MNGLLFDIQRFSVHDGPGIRTTFFLKGCPLRCGWCHNPEGLEGRVQLQYRDELCIHCAECAGLCPQHVHSFDMPETDAASRNESDGPARSEAQHTVDFTLCDACGECTQACPSGALSLMGAQYSPEDVLRAAKREAAFYGKDGGVTFSGGEASRQVDFLAECLTLCREAGFHTAVDTCGLMPRDTLLRLARLCDLFLYDIKAVSADLHKRGTGADNAQILENYRTLTQLGCRIWVRVPVIGAFNASSEEMTRIAEFLCECGGAEQIELMPYHKLGIGKYAQLGLDRPDDSERAVSHEQMQEYYEIFSRLGLAIQGAEGNK